MVHYSGRMPPHRAAFVLRPSVGKGSGYPSAHQIFSPILSLMNHKKAKKMLRPFAPPPFNLYPQKKVKTFFKKH